jgi:hypothetical protein
LFLGVHEVERGENPPARRECLRTWRLILSRDGHRAKNRNANGRENFCFHGLILDEQPARTVTWFCRSDENPKTRGAGRSAGV